jgi:hypothetical protein
MNHLPFDWSDAVDDNHVMAHFVGGAWDGKTYAIPLVDEWKVFSHLASCTSEIAGVSSPKYDLAVYKKTIHIGKEAIYWFTRIEKGDE